MKTRNLIRTTTTLAAAASLLSLAGPAMAAITIVNGDFNEIADGNATQPNGSWDDNVSGWFDDTDDFASATHDDRHHAFISNTTPHALFADNTRLGDSGQFSYIYQNIGTRLPADSSITIGFEMGRPSSDAAATISVVLSLYQSAAFTGIEGSTGYLPTAATDEVLIGTQTITLTDHPGGADNATPQSVLFDLASANTTDNLFLMLQTGAASAGFFQVDNLAATSIPEPSTAVLFGLGGLALVFRRRK